MQTLASSCKCKSAVPKQRVNGNFGFLPGIAIALLPKCPFCIAAYSSAITVCSSKSMAADSEWWTPWISIAFAALTLAITLHNYKGARTQVASMVVLVGLIMISYCELVHQDTFIYYAGCSVLVFGVWLNGSFLFLIKYFSSLPVGKWLGKFSWLK